MSFPLFPDLLFDRLCMNSHRRICSDEGREAAADVTWTIRWRCTKPRVPPLRCARWVAKPARGGDSA